MGRRVGWFRVALAAVALVLMPRAAAAAVHDSTALRVQLGPAFDAHSDLRASPFHFHGTGFAAAVSLAHGGFEVTASGGRDRAGSRIESSSGGYEDVYAASFDVRWAHRVASLGAHTTVDLGADLGAVALRRVHRYAPQFDERLDDVAFPLAVSVGVGREIGSRGSIDERVDIGLLSAFLRSQYGGAGTLPAAWWAGPAGIRIVRHRLRISWRASPRLGASVTDGFRFLATDRGKPLRVVSQDVSLGVSIFLHGGGGR